MTSKEEFDSDFDVEEFDNFQLLYIHYKELCNKIKIPILEEKDFDMTELKQTVKSYEDHICMSNYEDELNDCVVFHPLSPPRFAHGRNFNYASYNEKNSEWSNNINEKNLDEIIDIEIKNKNIYDFDLYDTPLENTVRENFKHLPTKFETRKRRKYYHDYNNKNTNKKWQKKETILNKIQTDSAIDLKLLGGMRGRRNLADPTQDDFFRDNEYDEDIDEEEKKQERLREIYRVQETRRELRLATTKTIKKEEILKELKKRNIFRLLQQLKRYGTLNAEQILTRVKNNERIDNIINDLLQEYDQEMNAIINLFSNVEGSWISEVIEEEGEDTLNYKQDIDHIKIIMKQVEDLKKNETIQKEKEKLEQDKKQLQRKEAALGKLPFQSKKIQLKPGLEKGIGKIITDDFDKPIAQQQEEANKKHKESTERLKKLYGDEDNQMIDIMKEQEEIKRREKSLELKGKKLEEERLQKEQEEKQIKLLEKFGKTQLKVSPNELLSDEEEEDKKAEEKLDILPPDRITLQEPELNLPKPPPLRDLPKPPKNIDEYELSSIFEKAHYKEKQRDFERNLSQTEFLYELALWDLFDFSIDNLIASDYEIIAEDVGKYFEWIEKEAQKKNLSVEKFIFKKYGVMKGKDVLGNHKDMEKALEKIRVKFGLTRRPLPNFYRAVVPNYKPSSPLAQILEKLNPKGMIPPAIRASSLPVIHAPIIPASIPPLPIPPPQPIPSQPIVQPLSLLPSIFEHHANNFIEPPPLYDKRPKTDLAQNVLIELSRLAHDLNFNYDSFTEPDVSLLYFDYRKYMKAIEAFAKKRFWSVEESLEAFGEDKIIVVEKFKKLIKKLKIKYNIPNYLIPMEEDIEDIEDEEDKEEDKKDEKSLEELKEKLSDQLENSLNIDLDSGSSTELEDETKLPEKTSRKKPLIIPSSIDEEEEEQDDDDDDDIHGVGNDEEEQEDNAITIHLPRDKKDDTDRKKLEEINKKKQQLEEYRKKLRKQVMDDIFKPDYELEEKLFEDSIKNLPATSKNAARQARRQYQRALRRAARRKKTRKAKKRNQRSSHDIPEQYNFLHVQEYPGNKIFRVRYHQNIISNRVFRYYSYDFIFPRTSSRINLIPEVHVNCREEVIQETEEFIRLAEPMARNCFQHHYPDYITDEMTWIRITCIIQVCDVDYQPDYPNIIRTEISGGRTRDIYRLARTDPDHELVCNTPWFRNARDAVPSLLALLQRHAENYTYCGIWPVHMIFYYRNGPKGKMNNLVGGIVSKKIEEKLGKIKDEWFIINPSSKKNCLWTSYSLGKEINKELYDEEPDKNRINKLITDKKFQNNIGCKLKKKIGCTFENFGCEQDLYNICKKDKLPIKVVNTFGEEIVYLKYNQDLDIVEKIQSKNNDNNNNNNKENNDIDIIEENETFYTIYDFEEEQCIYLLLQHSHYHTIIYRPIIFDYIQDIIDNKKYGKEKYGKRLKIRSTKNKEAKKLRKIFTYDLESYRRPLKGTDDEIEQIAYAIAWCFKIENEIELEYCENNEYKIITTNLNNEEIKIAVKQIIEEGCLDDAIEEWMENDIFHQGIFYAHNGGKFDLRLILGQSSLCVNDLYIIQSMDLIELNGRFLNMTIYHKTFINENENENHYISFKDSLPLFGVGNSLASLCNEFKVPHKKMEELIGVHEMQYENTWKTNWIQYNMNKYLENDVLGLLEVLICFEKECFNNTCIHITEVNTGASLAKKHFLKNLYNDDCTTNSIFTLRQEEDDFIRKAFNGGRVENFVSKYYENTKLYYYDFTSLYPDVARLNLPTGYPIWTLSPEDLKNNSIEYNNNKINESWYSRIVLRNHYNLKAFWKVIITSPNVMNDINNNNNIRKPLLGCKCDLTGGSFLFTWFAQPTELTLYEEEILLAIDLKLDYEFIPVNCITFSSAPVLKEAMNKLFKLKADAKKEGKHALSKLWKIVINSLFGVWGLRKYDREGIEIALPKESNWCLDLVREKLIDVEQIGNYVVTRRLKDLEVQDCNVSIAAAITAEARIKLYKLICDIQDHHGEILYCDTDSIITTLCIEEDPILKSKWIGDNNGEELGALKNEIDECYEKLIKKFPNENIIKKKYFDCGVIIAPKMYYVGAENHRIIKKAHKGYREDLSKADAVTYQRMKKLVDKDIDEKDRTMEQDMIQWIGSNGDILKHDIGVKNIKRHKIIRQTVNKGILDENGNIQPFKKLPKQKSRSNSVNNIYMDEDGDINMIEQEEEMKINLNNYDNEEKEMIGLLNELLLKDYESIFE